MDDRVQQQTERIEYASFFTLDLLACIATMRIDARAGFFGALRALPIDDGDGWTRSWHST
jgi:hypothetical protein